MVYLNDSYKCKIAQAIFDKIKRDFESKSISEFVLMYDTEEKKVIIVDYSILENCRRNTRKLMLLVYENKRFWETEPITIKYIKDRYISLI